MRKRWDVRIEASESGLHVLASREGAWTIPWESITEIEGFKRDRITTDLICLLIRYDDGAEQAVEINEDMEGFSGAASELERRSLLKPTWREYVTLPPFEERRFVLFTSAKRR